MKTKNSWETKKKVLRFFEEENYLRDIQRISLSNIPKNQLIFWLKIFTREKIWDFLTKIGQSEWQKMRIIGFVLLQTIFTADEVYVAGKLRSKRYSRVL